MCYEVRCGVDDGVWLCQEDRLVEVRKLTNVSH